jgi:hypothetical protein
MSGFPQEAQSGRPNEGASQQHLDQSRPFDKSSTGLGLTLLRVTRLTLTKFPGIIGVARA